MDVIVFPFLREDTLGTLGTQIIPKLESFITGHFKKIPAQTL
jgi:hypothetical protein